MAVVNAGLLGIEEENLVPKDPNLFVGGADALAESNRARMQPNINLTPSQMTPSGANLEEYRAAEAAANAAQAPPMSTPVTRDFDPDAYLRAMATGGSQMNRETGIMGALGYALKLQNPSFNASGYIKNYKARKHAQMKQQWGAMTKLNQHQVERQIVNQMMKANPENISEFKQFWSGLGVPNLSMMNRTFDVWRKINPAVDPAKDFTTEGRLTAKGISSKHKEYRQQTKNLVNGAFEWRRKIALVMAGLREGTGLGDISAINSFQKMIDEGVVRGEDVKMIGSAASALEQLQLTMNNFSKGEKLAEGTRAQMAKIAKDFYDAGTAQVDERLKGWRDVVQDNDQLDWNKVVPQKSWAVLQDPEIAKIPARLQKLMRGSVENPMTFGTAGGHNFETIDDINKIPTKDEDKWEGKFVILPDGTTVVIQR